MAKFRKAKKELAEVAWKPRLPRGMRALVPTSRTANAKPTTERGIRRAERNKNA